MLVVERLRAVLPPTTAVLPNVRWLARDHGSEGASRARQHPIVIGSPAVLGRLQ